MAYALLSNTFMLQFLGIKWGLPLKLFFFLSFCTHVMGLKQLEHNAVQRTCIISHVCHSANGCTYLFLIFCYKATNFIFLMYE